MGLPEAILKSVAGELPVRVLFAPGEAERLAAAANTRALLALEDIKMAMSTSRDDHEAAQKVMDILTNLGRGK